MILIISLLVIGAIVGFTLLIQYLVKDPNPNPPNSPITMESVAMIVADIHIEPWYTTKGAAQNHYNPDTIDDWTKTSKLICSGVGDNAGDTPIGLFKSAIQDFSKDVLKEQRLFFFAGDTFAHDLRRDKPDVNIEKTIMYKIFDKKEGLLNYFDPSNIFYAIGNHGGKTQQTFFQKDTVSEAWTQSIVDNGIYTPSGPDDIFWDIGYYKKPIPNSTIYVICFNSIIYKIVSNHDGCSGDNCTKKQQRQIDQLKKDLDSLGPKNSAYILTHFPIDSWDPSKVAVENFIWSKIGKEYQDKVSGILTAHSHAPLANLDHWDTKKGTAYTWNIPSIFWSGSNVIPNKSVSSYIKVPFPLNEPLVLAETDVRKTVCKNGVSTDSIQWVN